MWQEKNKIHTNWKEIKLSHSCGHDCLHRKSQGICKHNYTANYRAWQGHKIEGQQQKQVHLQIMNNKTNFKKIYESSKIIKLVAIKLKIFI